MIPEIVTGAVAFGAVGFLSSARIVRQYERGVVFRLGRVVSAARKPGLTMVVPGIDHLRHVNMQIVTLPIPAQEGITRDNVTVRVDAVVYFKVVDATDAIVRVEDYRFAVSQVAQTSLRSIIGKSDLDDLLGNRENLNQGLEVMIDSPAVGWGVHIDRVEIKDVSLPESMKRSMSRQAEAERERRARIINADAELKASHKLADAAHEMSRQPAALQLRLLQTVVAVAAEKNSTLVLPFPVELLRFLERAQGGTAPDGAQQDGHAGSAGATSLSSAAEGTNGAEDDVGDLDPAEIAAALGTEDDASETVPSGNADLEALVRRAARMLERGEAPDADSASSDSASSGSVAGVPLPDPLTADPTVPSASKTDTAAESETFPEPEQAEEGEHSERSS